MKVARSVVSASAVALAVSLSLSAHPERPAPGLLEEPPEPVLHAEPAPVALLDTGGVFGDPMGAFGFDLCTEQAAASRFRPEGDVTVDRLEVWLMAHLETGELGAPIIASLRHDAGGRPSDEAITSIEVARLSGGWRPERVGGQFDPVTLLGGRNYWLVLDCQAAPGKGAVWCFAGTYAASANTFGSSTNWQQGAVGPVGAGALAGTEACYADCDQSGTLDLYDFVRFQAQFLAADAGSCDCDLSTGEAQCDLFDFICFQDKFLDGCD